MEENLEEIRRESRRNQKDEEETRKMKKKSEGIVGREWLQRRHMFRLRCHNFELTKPASWCSELETSLSARKVLGSICGPIPGVSSVVKHKGQSVR